MAKIILIDNDIVTIGTDSGGIEEARMCDLNFYPQIGDEVDVYRSETKTIVVKREPQSENDASQVFTSASPNGGVNININNENTNTNVMPEASSPAAGKKAVNKIAYCLLALFLGDFGIHKFYAGKTGKGVLYLVFCWTVIPWIVSFIEFIMALCQKADANGNILV